MDDEMRHETASASKSSSGDLGSTNADSTSSAGESTEHTEWSNVDRNGFPAANNKSQPWKSLDIPDNDDEWQPARWNIVGRAWKQVQVAVDLVWDLGTGNTWSVLTLSPSLQNSYLHPAILRYFPAQFVCFLMTDGLTF